MGSGSFASETQTYLNIHADWSVRSISTTQVEITVTVYCDHQSMYTIGLSKAVNIMLDGQYISLDSPAIEQDGNEFHSTVIGTHTFTLDVAQGESRDVQLSVEWGYGGEYGSPNGRVHLDSLECGGSIHLSR